MRSLLIILFSTLALFTLSEGYQQELILHESYLDNGTYHVYHSDMPDFTWFPMERIKRYCYRGIIVICPEVNYTAIKPSACMETFAKADLTCYNTTWRYASFRFGGSMETEDDVVSLYSEQFLRGDVFHVPRSPYGFIEGPILSVVYSGRSSWTVFEGPNFDGKSACLEAPPEDTMLDSWGSFYNLGVQTIRSVVKGCPPAF